MAYEVNCFICLKVFKVSPSRYKNRNNFFCSRNCESVFKINNCKTKIETKCTCCSKFIKIKKSAFLTRKNGVCCSRKCSNIIKQTLYKGRKNPNCIYKNLDDNFFKTVDTENKAYLLGWIASDGNVSKNKSSIRIKISIKDLEILTKLRNIFCKDIPISFEKQNKMISISINSKEINNDICCLLGIKPGKKDRIVKMPYLNEQLTWSFIRGYFDGDGTVRTLNSIKKYNYIDCSIASHSSYIKNSINIFCNIPCRINSEGIYFSGKNALYFLSKLYNNATIFLARKKERYDKWISKYNYKANY